MNTLAISAAVALSLGGAAAHAASYLCVAEHGSGMSFNKASRKWAPAVFDVSSNKYVITPAKDPQQATWEVRAFGSQLATATCKGDFNPSGNLFCSGFGSEFRMNKKNLRYMNVYLIGYWSDDLTGSDSVDPGYKFTQGSDTPSIEIGTCTAL